jgi:hypothetical protein
VKEATVTGAVSTVTTGVTAASAASAASFFPQATIAINTIGVSSNALRRVFRSRGIVMV